MPKPTHLSDADFHALRVMWVLILKKALPYKGEPNYYGGGSRPLPEELGGVWHLNVPAVDKWRADLYKKIATVGVDWEKTTVPEWREYSQFVGTNEPAETVFSLEGTLVLLDGESTSLAVDGADKQEFPTLETLVTLSEVLIGPGKVFPE